MGTPSPSGSPSAPCGPSLSFGSRSSEIPSPSASLVVVPMFGLLSLTSSLLRTPSLSKSPSGPSSSLESNSSSTPSPSRSLPDARLASPGKLSLLSATPSPSESAHTKLNINSLDAGRYVPFPAKLILTVTVPESVNVIIPLLIEEIVCPFTTVKLTVSDIKLLASAELL